MKKVPICQLCKNDEAIWAYQPEGPDAEHPLVLLGNHYRGFPVVKVCDECAKVVRERLAVESTA